MSSAAEWKELEMSNHVRLGEVGGGVGTVGEKERGWTATGGLKEGEGVGKKRHVLAHLFLVDL